jgi:hypothetical protein
VYIGPDGSSCPLSACTWDGYSNAIGGAVYNDGQVTTLADDTIYGNSGVTGGGVYNAPGGVLTLISCTITGNTIQSGGTGGGVFSEAGSVLTLDNTILAGNYSAAGLPDNLAGVGRIDPASDYNLFGTGIDTSQLGAHNRTVVGDPGLSQFQNYGGAYGTLAPLPNSLAVGNGDPNLANNPLYNTDENGLPLTSAPNIGAVQFIERAHQLMISGPTGPVQHGAQLFITVCALDLYGNVVTNYGGTIQIVATPQQGSSVPPVMMAYTFNPGVDFGQAYINFPLGQGMWTFSAMDTQDSTINTNNTQLYTANVLAL